MDSIEIIPRNRQDGYVVIVRQNLTKREYRTENTTNAVALVELLLRGSLPRSVEPQEEKHDKTT
jgi:hypothetical protein